MASRVHPLAAPRGAAPSAAGDWTWRHAPVVAAAMIVVIAVRLHELVPATAVFAPALLLTFGGTGLVLSRTSRGARQRMLRHPLARLTLAYWLFMILTMPFALWPGLSVGNIRYFLPGVALVVTTLLCAPERRTVHMLQRTLVFATVIYAAYVRLFGRVFGEGRLEAGIGMYDSNDMAALFALAFPLALGLARSERGAVRVAAAISAVLFVMLILASGSRGGLIGLGAGAAVFAFGMRGTIRAVAVGSFAVGLVGLSIFSPAFNERLSSITDLEDDYNLTHEVGRKAVWTRGGGYILDNPLLGVGVGNFPIAEGDWFEEFYHGTRGAKWSNAHNAYIQAYAELGIIGGSLFVALLVYGMRRSWRLWRGVRLQQGGIAHRPEFFASLAAFMVCGVFLSHAYFLPLLALLGIIASADRLVPPAAAVPRNGGAARFAPVR